MIHERNIITAEQAQTLSSLFRIRLEQSPDKVAYQQFDAQQGQWVGSTWAEMAREVAKWQAALQAEGLKAGDRVAIMLRNCREWVMFDQACLGLGLVTVPLYTDDRPDNVAYILENAGAKLLLLEGKFQWQRLKAIHETLNRLRVISIQAIEADPQDTPAAPGPIPLTHWLDGREGELISGTHSADSLATIVYTSGTTGRSKGVMLSHYNLLFNAYACTQCADIDASEVFLSFLPLSHTLERTAGYYMPMMLGAEVAFSRSVQQLPEDLQAIRPTVLISVPRIYERIYAKVQMGLEEKSPLARKLFSLTLDTGWQRFERQQGRAGWHPKLLLWPLLARIVAGKITARLGGRLQYAVSGGAPLPPPIAQFFIGLGVPVYHGYGMTEASPVISVNRTDDNIPASIGTPLPGVEVKIGANDEVLTRSPCIMQGYWNNAEATREVIDAEGWLHTGDKARYDEHGHLYITGRIKEIIVLSSGEKVPPADMEMAITLDPLFEQAMVVGEGKPFLSAIVVLNEEQWPAFAQSLELDPEDIEILRSRQVEKVIKARIAQLLRNFPGYAQVRRITPTIEQWNVEGGLLTPTLKMKRARIMERFGREIDSMYADY
ncbi:AMP-dependent synthetase/ligase [Thiorhodospira sibirica]|uniref:AMP-dependent synthetase/ligase n=1 Tax=Thiorhodospira sibirica TaxID=154347 RepID=UPI00022C0523|nr:AMP-dependent synthetase/ligase [Thiorhodospira sibirica]